MTLNMDMALRQIMDMVSSWLKGWGMEGGGLENLGGLSAVSLQLNFYDHMFAFLHSKSLLKWFRFIAHPFSEEMTNTMNLPKRVSIHI